MKITQRWDMESSIGDKSLKSTRENGPGCGDQTRPFTSAKEQCHIDHAVKNPEDDGEEMPVPTNAQVFPPWQRQPGRCRYLVIKRSIDLILLHWHLLFRKLDPLLTRRTVIVPVQPGMSSQNL